MNVRRLRRITLFVSIGLALAIFLLVAWANLAHADAPVPLAEEFRSVGLGRWVGFGVLALLVIGAAEAVAIYLPLFLPEPRVPVPDETGLHLHARCAQCGTFHWVKDTGERPLAHFCPVCGNQGTYDPREGAQKGFVYTEMEIKLGCRKCHATFTVPEPLVRPLYTQCPRCGARGVIGRDARTVQAAEARIACRHCGFAFEVYTVGAPRETAFRCPRCKERSPRATEAAPSSGGTKAN